MAAITKVSAEVRPVNANQCIIRQLVSGEAIDVGEAVYIDTTTGAAMLAAGGTAATVQFVGIVVAIGSEGRTVGAGAGETLSVVLSGPVAGFDIGAGVIAYVSNTEGALADAAGTKAYIAGIGLPGNILLVGNRAVVPAV